MHQLWGEEGCSSLQLTPNHSRTPGLVCTDCSRCSLSSLHFKAPPSTGAILRAEVCASSRVPLFPGQAREGIWGETEQRRNCLGSVTGSAPASKKPQTPELRSAKFYFNPAMNLLFYPATPRPKNSSRVIRGDLALGEGNLRPQASLPGDFRV